MKRIAICGNIASGKSTVQKIIAEKGYKVLDTDEVSHELLTVSNAELYNAFKDYDVFDNGEFSRDKVGQLIFSEEDARLKINSIMHPQISNEIERFYIKNKDEDCLFVAIPLLFESKMEKLFDKIIFVYTNDDIRLARLIMRNNYALEYAKARINCQMPQDRKAALSDYVIYNNDTVEVLRKQVEDVLSLIALA